MTERGWICLLLSILGISVILTNYANISQAARIDARIDALEARCRD